MKASTVVGIVLTASLLPIGLAHAEQKIVFNVESISYKQGTYNCEELCMKSYRSGPPIASLLSSGWRIISSSPKQKIAADYHDVRCSTCLPLGCTCIGTEYVVERVGPAPQPSIEELDRETEQLKKEAARIEAEHKELMRRYEMIMKER